MSLTLTTQIQIHAPTAAVWEALTSPAMVKQYFFGTDLVTDWQVGSPIYFRGEWDGTPYEDKGVILEFVPQQRMSFDYLSSFSGLADLPENYAQISYVLLEQDGVCTLTITQNKLPDEEKLAHSEQNWQAIMGEMKKILEY
jgi:uncharacterized protein YndB with AHSA1/START domain